MNRSSLVSLLVAFVLAVLAVVGVQSYLRGQQAALVAENTVEPEPPDNTIIVAAVPLRFGMTVDTGSLRSIAWQSDDIPEGAFRTVEEVIGETGKPRYVMSAIEIGEPLLSNKITGPGQRATLSAALAPGMKAVSIRINDVLGVAGFVLPGDRVDVMLTRSSGSSNISAANASTDVLLQGIKVLAIDQMADERANKAAVVKTITFEVSTADAQKLTLAQSIGTLSLTLRNVASSEFETIQPVNIGDLGGGFDQQPVAATGFAPQPEVIVKQPSTAKVAVYRDSKKTEYNVLNEVK